MHHLSNLLFFGIPLLYYYVNLNSSIICCLFFGDIYLSFGIPLLASFDDNSLDFFECNSVDTHVILSAILWPIKSPVASAVFELIFLKQFLLHLLQIFYQCQQVFDYTYYLCF